MKLQSAGNGARMLERVQRRARVARNCSGRSDVGGGLKRFWRVAGGGGGGSAVAVEVFGWGFAEGFGGSRALGWAEG